MSIWHGETSRVDGGDGEPHGPSRDSTPRLVPQSRNHAITFAPPQAALRGALPRLPQTRRRVQLLAAAAVCLLGAHPPPPGSTPNESRMTTMFTRQQRHKRCCFPMLTDREDETIIGPLHEANIYQNRYRL